MGFDVLGAFQAQESAGFKVRKVSAELGIARKRNAGQLGQTELFWDVSLQVRKLKNQVDQVFEVAKLGGDGAFERAAQSKARQFGEQAYFRRDLTVKATTNIKLAQIYHEPDVSAQFRTHNNLEFYQLSAFRQVLEVNRCNISVDPIHSNALDVQEVFDADKRVRMVLKDQSCDWRLIASKGKDFKVLKQKSTRPPCRIPRTICYFKLPRCVHDVKTKKVVNPMQSERVVFVVHCVDAACCERIGAYRRESIPREQWLSDSNLSDKQNQVATGSAVLEKLTYLVLHAPDDLCLVLSFWFSYVSQEVATQL